MTNADVSENIKRIKYNMSEALYANNRDADDAVLMAVTKTVPAEFVNTAISCGVTLLGENRVQEYFSKKDEYILDNVKVHFIGHLQSNKVKKLIDYVDMIESVDSISLINEINKQAKEKNIIKDVLLEINISEESTKNGFSKTNINEIVSMLSEYKNISLRGLMCIPSPGDGEKYFPVMQELYLNCKQQYKNIDTLSMGMSDDYITAVKYGSTVVRLGSAIFGKRNYGGSSL